MANPPLAGLRVLDLSQAFSGPYCAMMLGDAGADVLKIEPIEVGDHVRQWLVTGKVPVATYIHAANRSKRSLALDLKQNAGRELLLDMAARADVLIENFRPGVMDRLGVGYEQVKRRNGRLVYCSISGFGQSGPLAHQAAYDLIAAGYGGTMSVTGEEGGRYVRPGVPISDLLAAMAAAFAIMLALSGRQQTGSGQYLDISLLDVQAFAMAHHLLAQQVTGQPPGLHGSAHAQVAPYQSYRTGTTDINVACLNEKQWQAFCAQLGHEEWVRDPRNATPGSRNARRAELEAEIEEALAKRSAAEWLRSLSEAGIPCGPINTTAELVDEPQLEMRGMYLEMHDPAFGPLRVPGAPWKAEGVLEHYTDAPTLGQHTDEILREVLGLSEERLRELRAAKVVA